MNTKFKIQKISSLFMLLLLFSCANKEKQQIETGDYLQKWELVKMSGQMVNSETTGQDMAWQEYYLLQENDTFTKHRTQDGKESQASGTYTIEELSDGKYLVLTYDSDSPLIGNCTGDLKETLFFQSENTLTGTWVACDGPGLEYTLVNNR